MHQFSPNNCYSYLPRMWIGEGNGNPLQCSCLENPRDGGAWWAAIYGVTQSRTQLKRLSSSSRKLFLISVFSLWRTDTLKRPWTCVALWKHRTRPEGRGCKAKAFHLFFRNTFLQSSLITWERILTNKGCLGLGWTAFGRSLIDKHILKGVRLLRGPSNPHYNSHL